MITIILAAAVVLRFWSRSDLWLDEALTVNISSLPLTELPGALRHDGAPPLYYLLLHFWIRLFGPGDFSVRALSGLLAVATLPVMWLAARRAGGKAVAWAAVLLLASSPFAVRYATEARMYALVTLLSLLTYLAICRALDRPSPARLLSVALVSGLLMLTHYWALYFLGAVAAWLALRTVRKQSAPASVRTLAAVTAGGVLFLPWLPIFLFQIRHTGTPWNQATSFRALLFLPELWAGEKGEGARVLGIALFVLAGLGLVGRAVGERRMELDRGIRPWTRDLFMLFIGTFALAALAGLVGGGGFSSRYTSVVLPFFLLLASAGVATLSKRKGSLTLLVVVALGFGSSVRTALADRTQGSQIARAIRSAAEPGDVIVYCPDQLGPSVSRLLPNHYDQLTFPSGSSPRFVNWTDYGARNRSAPIRSFARKVSARAGAERNIWLVVGYGYRTLGEKCENLRAELLAQHFEGVEVISADEDYGEAQELFLFPPVQGLWAVSSDGRVFASGDAKLFGSLEGRRLNASIVGIKASPSGRGYWLVASDGRVFPFGDAERLDPIPGELLTSPVVGMAATPTGKGYWLLTSNGGVFTVGDAKFFGSRGKRSSGAPMVAMAATPMGKGYWLFAQDGGVFAFGDATFYGSGKRSKTRIVSADSLKGGGGYWLLASDGRLMAFGQARWFGSLQNLPLDLSSVVVAGAPSDRGYWIATSEGYIFPFGGEGQRAKLDAPVVAVEGWAGTAERATRRWRQTARDDPVARRSY